MTKKFSVLQLFSLTDGRMSTNIDDIYDMINHVCDDNLMTHHLPVAFNYLKLKNPKWFEKEKSRIAAIYIQHPHLKVHEGDSSAVKKTKFEQVISLIINQHNDDIYVPQLKDEFDTSDFGNYMIDNSLLLKKFG